MEQIKNAAQIMFTDFMRNEDEFLRYQDEDGEWDHAFHMGIEFVEVYTEAGTDTRTLTTMIDWFDDFEHQEYIGELPSDFFKPCLDILDKGDPKLWRMLVYPIRTLPKSEIVCLKGAERTRVRRLLGNKPPTFESLSAAISEICDRFE